MPNQVTEYRCLLISPMDVTAERDALTHLVNQWNAQIGVGLKARIELVRWESHAVPDMAMPAQNVINDQLLKDCDLGIAVFWSKLGTPTAKHPSGSVEEVYGLLHKGARVLVYFCDLPIPQAALRDDQYAKLQETKRTFQNQGLYAVYSDVASLCSQAQLHLTSVVSEMLAKDTTATPFVPASGSMTAPTPDVRVTANPGLIRDMNPFAGGTTKTLIVTVENHSPSVVYLGNIQLEMKDGLVATPLQDFSTGEYQQKKELHPGQSHSLTINPEKFREKASEFVCAVAVDEIGRRYRSDKGLFPLALKLALS